MPNTDQILLCGFNLFFGKNEYGKTLVIDAIVKLLLGRNIRDFNFIDRVEETPGGYVIVEDDKGREIKLPEKGDLTKVVDLKPSECNNIFIIRNSNLSIARESDFYTNVTDRLTGLRTEYISSIKRKLQVLGKLTRADSSADLSKSKDFGKIKSRMNSARALIKKTDEMQEKTTEQNFDELERGVSRIGEEKNEIERKIESFEHAQKREKYGKGKKALDKLNEALEKLRRLDIYNKDHEQTWRRCENDIENRNVEKIELLTDIEQNKKELKEINERLREKKRDFEVFDERKKKLDNEVKTELTNYERKREELAPKEAKSKFFTSVMVFSVILLGISLLGAIVTSSLFFYVFGALFLILCLISGVFKFQLVKDRAWLAETFERIRIALSKLELSAESSGGILSNIQKFDEEYRKETHELQDMERKKENSDGKIKELRDERIPKVEEKIREAQKKIEEIKRKSNEESLAGYAGKLKLKEGLEQSTGNQKSALESLFGKKSENSEENISYWNEENANLEVYKDKAKKVKYNEKNVSDLKAEKQSREKELKKIKENMISFQKEMEEIERNANGILRLEEEHLYCKTSVDLEAIEEELQGFIDENESNKDYVLRVMKIFEEIEKEEKEKVYELFGKSSPISKFFHEITDGLYEEVSFNQEKGKIEVKRKDGVMFEAEKLSGGTYDQLYLSIRLALGEKLLKGGKGFFIMDDPFIKADKDRLQKQISILKRISKSGWQIIYFTAKDEVKSVLKKDIQHNKLNYIEIPSIFS